LLLITNRLINKGVIECNGGRASEYGSGGGSGGSVLIDVLSEDESCIFGCIEAIGGMGMRLKGVTKNRGGDGGNGRICINNQKLAQSPNVSTGQIRPSPLITWQHRVDGNQYRM